MSISAMVAVRDYSSAKGSRLLLLLMIADVVNDLDSNSARNCSLELLCQRARIDRRNAKRFLIELCESGELITEITPGKMNVYSIPILPGEDGYAPEKCTNPDHDCSKFHTPLSITRDKTPRPARQKKPRQQRYGKRIGRGTGTPTQAPEADGGVAEPLHGGVAEPLHPVQVPLHGGVPVPPNPLLPLISPNIYTQRAHTREDSPPLEENLERAEPESRPPTPPGPPPSASKEQRAVWSAVQRNMAERGVAIGQLSVMRSAHLYQVQRGVWWLQVPRGYDVSKFRARYEDLIIDAISVELHTGNQVVEFAS